MNSLHLAEEKCFTCSGHIDRRRKRFGVESQRCSNFNPAPDTILRDRKRFATVTTDELHG